MDWKYVVGLLVGFFGTGYIISKTIAPLLGGAELGFIGHQWAPTLNKALKQASPQQLADLRRQMKQSPDITPELEGMGIHIPPGYYY